MRRQGPAAAPAVVTAPAASPASQAATQQAAAPAPVQNSPAAADRCRAHGSPPPTALPSPTPTRAPLPPTVVSTKPDRGEEQVISSPVVVTFDQPMDPASTSRAFSIEPKAPGEVKVSGNALTFSPSGRLERGKEYRVTLASNAASAAGLKLQRDVTFKFVTAGFLQVTGTQPADRAQ